MSESNGYLTTEAIFGQRLPTKDVDIPEWGGKVSVRSLTTPEKDLVEFKQWQIQTCDEPDPDEYTATKMEAIVMGTLVPSFTAADIERLKPLSALPVGRIYNAISDLSGMGVAGTSRVDDEKKSSSNIQPNASGIDSSSPLEDAPSPS